MKTIMTIFVLILGSFSSAFAIVEDVLKLELESLRKECELDQSKCEKYSQRRQEYSEKLGKEFLSSKDKREMKQVVDRYFQQCMKDESVCVDFEGMKDAFERLSESSYQYPGGFQNMVPSTCKWSADFGRRIVKGPSCGNEGVKICVGYVTCDQKFGMGQFTRMSVCSPKNCGASDEDAVACTLEAGYGSLLPPERTVKEKSSSSVVPNKVLKGKQQ